MKPNGSCLHGRAHTEMANFYNSINLRYDIDSRYIARFVQFTWFPLRYARLPTEHIIDGHSVRFNQRLLDGSRHITSNLCKQWTADSLQYYSLYNNISARQRERERDSSFARNNRYFNFVSNRDNRESIVFNCFSVVNAL